MKLNIFSASLWIWSCLILSILTSRGALRHIFLSYIKNDNINYFHTKMLWLFGCARFGKTRVNRLGVLPIYLTVSMVQGGSLAVSTGTAATHQDP